LVDGAIDYNSRKEISMKLIAVALLTLAIAAPAYAFDGHDWGWKRPRAVHQHPHYRHVHRVARLYRGSDHDVRHEDGRHSDESRRDEGRCLDHYEEVVSTEHTESGDGMTSAHKLWAARVQWYFGSRMMNPDNAKDAKFVCDQSSAMDTITGRLIDSAQKIIGNEGKNQRCVFRAIPCAAPLESADKSDENRAHDKR
jgi:hypothetical protein